jgi:thymidylate synthase
MRTYLNIVKDVLENGQWKYPVRRNNRGEWQAVDGGVQTLTLPNQVFSHDMKNGFPLLTTKKMPFKTICVELEGFINGVTDKSWYQERGCKIWDEWCNPEQVELRMNWIRDKHPLEYRGEKYDNENDLKKAIQKEQMDLGPIYGFQWRNFDGQYSPEEPISQFGYDQLKTIVNTLRSNPMDRRMVCSAWNPNQIRLMALPPCHYSWGVTAIGSELHLHWEQRSCDLMLGVPFNIASYALLLTLLSAEAGLIPGNLTGLLVDCHIYENQIEGAKEQIKRKPHHPPRVFVRHPGSTIPYEVDSSKQHFDIFEWTHKDVMLTEYTSHPKLSFGDVVV